MAYILALPDIYERAIEDKMFHEAPFLWTYEYEDKSYERTEYGETFLVYDFEVKMDGKDQPVSSEAYMTLSGGYVKLVHLAVNLFNSNSDEFNLMNALATWDDDLFKIYQQAVMIRIGRDVEGMTVQFDKS